MKKYHPIFTVERDIDLDESEILNAIQSLSYTYKDNPSKLIDKMVDIIYDSFVGYVSNKEVKKLKDYFIKSIHKCEEFNEGY